MNQNLFEKILVSLYPNKKIIVKEYEFHERYDFDDSLGKLIPINPAIFVGIQFCGQTESNHIDSEDTLDIENTINKFTSNDFNIYKV